jgi:hypothetical protein
MSTIIASLSRYRSASVGGLLHSAFPDAIYVACSVPEEQKLV